MKLLNRTSQQYTTTVIYLSSCFAAQLTLTAF